ncbi:MaoC family dehydratase [Microbacterium sp. RD1]|uniref:MaoC family dehydratase n=1 Tax=Microbacterium sp. RD1 TaxID=3457313 RepID=UPI003FA57B9C
MSDLSSAPPVQGEIFSLGAKKMTRERMRWYCDALETTARADGTFVVAEPTIHSDDDFARNQGLPGIIADGMLSTNYLSSLLYRRFGMDYLFSGELDTKFIRPVYEDEIVTAYGRVTEIDGDRVELELWCEVGPGKKCTVGRGSVRMGAAA